MELVQETVEPQTLEEIKVGMKLRGTVVKLEIFGAIVDIGLDADALLHISQISPTVNNVADAYKVNQELEVYVLKIHSETGRIALATRKPPTISWEDLSIGMKLTGSVTRIERYGAFVDVGCERAGMIHVSEMADGYISSPNEMLNIGQEVDVWVLKFDPRKQQIDLTMKEPQQQMEEEQQEDEALPTAMEIAFKRAMKSDGKNSKNYKHKDNQRSLSLEQEEIITRTLREHTKAD